MVTAGHHPGHQLGVVSLVILLHHAQTLHRVDIVKDIVDRYCLDIVVDSIDKYNPSSELIA